MDDYDPACPTEDDCQFNEIDLSQVPLPPSSPAPCEDLTKDATLPPSSHPKLDKEEDRRGRKKKKKKRRRHEESKSQPEEEEDKEETEVKDGLSSEVSTRSTEYKDIDGTCQLDSCSPNDSEIVPEVNQKKEELPPTPQPPAASDTSVVASPSASHTTALGTRSGKLLFKLAPDPTSGKAKVSFQLKKVKSAFQTTEKTEEEGENAAEIAKDVVEKTAATEYIPTRFKVPKKHDLYRPDQVEPTATVLLNSSATGATSSSVLVVHTANLDITVDKSNKTAAHMDPEAEDLKNNPSNKDTKRDKGKDKKHGCKEEKNEAGETDAHASQRGLRKSARRASTENKEKEKDDGDWSSRRRSRRGESNSGRYASPTSSYSRLEKGEDKQKKRNRKSGEDEGKHRYSRSKKEAKSDGEKNSDKKSKEESRAGMSSSSHVQVPRQEQSTSPTIAKPRTLRGSHTSPNKGVAAAISAGDSTRSARLGESIGSEKSSDIYLVMSKQNESVISSIEDVDDSRESPEPVTTAVQEMAVEGSVQQAGEDCTSEEPAEKLAHVQKIVLRRSVDSNDFEIARNDLAVSISAKGSTGQQDISETRNQRADLKDSSLLKLEDEMVKSAEETNNGFSELEDKIYNSSKLEDKLCNYSKSEDKINRSSKLEGTINSSSSKSEGKRKSRSSKLDEKINTKNSNLEEKFNGSSLKSGAYRSSKTEDRISKFSKSKRKRNESSKSQSRPFHSNIDSRQRRRHRSPSTSDDSDHQMLGRERESLVCKFPVKSSHSQKPQPQEQILVDVSAIPGKSKWEMDEDDNDEMLEDRVRGSEDRLAANDSKAQDSFHRRSYHIDTDSIQRLSQRAHRSTESFPSDGDTSLDHKKHKDKKNNKSEAKTEERKKKRRHTSSGREDEGECVTVSEEMSERRRKRNSNSKGEIDTAKIISYLREYSSKEDTFPKKKTGIDNVKLVTYLKEYSENMTTNSVPFLDVKSDPDSVTQTGEMEEDSQATTVPKDENGDGQRHAFPHQTNPELNILKDEPLGKPKLLRKEDVEKSYDMKDEPHSEWSYSRSSSQERDKNSEKMMKERDGRSESPVKEKRSFSAEANEKSSRQSRRSRNKRDRSRSVERSRKKRSQSSERNDQSVQGDRSRSSERSQRKRSRSSERYDQLVQGDRKRGRRKSRSRSPSSRSRDRRNRSGSASPGRRTYKRRERSRSRSWERSYARRSHRSPGRDSYVKTKQDSRERKERSRSNSPDRSFGRKKCNDIEDASSKSSRGHKKSISPNQKRTETSQSASIEKQSFSSKRSLKTAANNDSFLTPKHDDTPQPNEEGAKSLIDRKEDKKQMTKNVDSTDIKIEKCAEMSEEENEASEAETQESVNNSRIGTRKSVASLVIVKEICKLEKSNPASQHSGKERQIKLSVASTSRKMTTSNVLDNDEEETGIKPETSSNEAAHSENANQESQTPERQKQVVEVDEEGLELEHVTSSLSNAKDETDLVSAFLGEDELSDLESIENSTTVKSSGNSLQARSRTKIEASSPPHRLKFKYIPLWEMEETERLPATFKDGNIVEGSHRLALDYDSDSSGNSEEHSVTDKVQERSMQDPPALVLEELDKCEAAGNKNQNQANVRSFESISFKHDHSVVESEEINEPPQPNQIPEKNSQKNEVKSTPCKTDNSLFVKEFDFSLVATESDSSSSTGTESDSSSSTGTESDSSSTSTDSDSSLLVKDSDRLSMATESDTSLKVKESDISSIFKESDSSSVVIQSVCSLLVKEVNSSSMAKESDSLQMVRDVDSISTAKKSDGSSIAKEVDSSSVAKEIHTSSAAQEAYSPSHPSLEDSEDTSDHEAPISVKVEQSAFSVTGRPATHIDKKTLASSELLSISGSSKTASESVAPSTSHSISSSCQPPTLANTFGNGIPGNIASIPLPGMLHPFSGPGRPQPVNASIGTSLVGQPLSNLQIPSSQPSFFAPVRPVPPPSTLTGMQFSNIPLPVPKPVPPPQLGSTALPYPNLAFRMSSLPTAPVGQPNWGNQVLPLRAPSQLGVPSALSSQTLSGHGAAGLQCLRQAAPMSAPATNISFPGPVPLPAAAMLGSTLTMGAPTATALPSGAIQHAGQVIAAEDLAGSENRHPAMNFDSSSSDTTSVKFRINRFHQGPSVTQALPPPSVTIPPPVLALPSALGVPVTTVSVSACSPAQAQQHPVSASSILTELPLTSPMSAHKPSDTDQPTNTAHPKRPKISSILSQPKIEEVSILQGCGIPDISKAASAPEEPTNKVDVAQSLPEPDTGLIISKPAVSEDVPSQKSNSDGVEDKVISQPAEVCEDHAETKKVGQSSNIEGSKLEPSTPHSQPQREETKPSSSSTSTTPAVETSASLQAPEISMENIPLPGEVLPPARTRALSPSPLESAEPLLPPSEPTGPPAAVPTPSSSAVPASPSGQSLGSSAEKKTRYSQSPLAIGMLPKVQVTQSPLAAGPLPKLLPEPEESKSSAPLPKKVITAGASSTRSPVAFSFGAKQKNLLEQVKATSKVHFSVKKNKMVMQRTLIPGFEDEDSDEKEDVEAPVESSNAENSRPSVFAESKDAAVPSSMTSGLGKSEIELPAAVKMKGTSADGAADREPVPRSSSPASFEAFPVQVITSSRKEEDTPASSWPEFTVGKKGRREDTADRDGKRRSTDREAGSSREKKKSRRHSQEWERHEERNDRRKKSKYDEEDERKSSARKKERSDDDDEGDGVGRIKIKKEKDDYLEDRRGGGQDDRNDNRRRGHQDDRNVDRRSSRPDDDDDNDRRRGRGDDDGYKKRSRYDEEEDDYRRERNRDIKEDKYSRRKSRGDKEDDRSKQKYDDDRREKHSDRGRSRDDSKERGRYDKGSGKSGKRSHRSRDSRSKSPSWRKERGRDRSRDRYERVRDRDKSRSPSYDKGTGSLSRMKEPRSFKEELLEELSKPPVKTDSKDDVFKVSVIGSSSSQTYSSEYSIEPSYPSSADSSIYTLAHHTAEMSTAYTGQDPGYAAPYPPPYENQQYSPQWQGQPGQNAYTASLPPPHQDSPGQYPPLPPDHAAAPHMFHPPSYPKPGYPAGPPLVDPYHPISGSLPQPLPHVQPLLSGPPHHIPVDQHGQPIPLLPPTAGPPICVDQHGQSIPLQPPMGGPPIHLDQHGQPILSLQQPPMGGPLIRTDQHGQPIQLQPQIGGSPLPNIRIDQHGQPIPLQPPMGGPPVRVDQHGQPIPLQPPMGGPPIHVDQHGQPIPLQPPMGGPPILVDQHGQPLSLQQPPVGGLPNRVDQHGQPIPLQTLVGGPPPSNIRTDQLGQPIPLGAPHIRLDQQGQPIPMQYSVNQHQAAPPFTHTGPPSFFQPHNFAQESFLPPDFHPQSGSSPRPPLLSSPARPPLLKKPVISLSAADSHSFGSPRFSSPELVSSLKPELRPVRKSRFSALEEGTYSHVVKPSSSSPTVGSPTTTSISKSEALYKKSVDTSSSTEPSFETSLLAECEFDTGQVQELKKSSGFCAMEKKGSEEVNEPTVSSSGVEDSTGDTGSDSGTDSASQKPLKVKSRWRRNSEAEAVVHTSTLAPTSAKQLLAQGPVSNDTPDSSPKERMRTRSRAAAEEFISAPSSDTPPPPPPPGKRIKMESDNCAIPEKQAEDESTKILETALGMTSMESNELDLDSLMTRPDFPKFEIITENIHLTERKRSKSMKRMLCDCTTSRDDRSKGIRACGSDCLNRMLMIECGSRCPCGEYCTNKRFQKKQYSKTVPFKAGDNKGWGLRALEDMEDKGTFIMEYVGELLDYEEFVRRTKQYSKAGLVHHYFMALNADEVVDATLKGSISRFINHSCDPNCETQKWTVNGELRVGFFTRKAIKYGEELTFDYQFEHYGEAQKCYCGADNCRGYIGLVKSPTRNNKKKEKKKKEIFKDELLEEDIEKLSLLDGMRNKNHVLDLCRLMVRAEKVQHRLAILKILQDTTESACLRLFLDYHGLSLFWSWMADIGTSDYMPETQELKLLMLTVLKSLPVTNRTSLRESKIPDMVERWAVAAVVAARKPPPPPPPSVSAIAVDTFSSLYSVTADNEADATSEKVIPMDESAAAEEEGDRPAQAEPEATSSESSPPASPPPLLPSSSAVTPVSILASAKDSKDIKRKRRVTFAEVPVESSFSPEPPDDAEESDDISSSTQGPGEKDGAAAANEGSKFMSARKAEEAMMFTNIADSTSQKYGNDGTASDADNSDTEALIKDPLASLAAECISQWSSLKEVFKIPKRERVEERKRTEKELDVLYKKDLGSSDPFAKWKRSKAVRLSKKKALDEEERKLSTPKMSKEERRQLFEAQVKAEDEMAAQAFAEEYQRQQEAYVLHQQRLLEDPQYFYFHQQQQGDNNFDPSEALVDPATGQPIDPNMGQPIIDPNTGQPILDPHTGQPIIDPHTGQPIMDPSTGQPIIHSNSGQPLMDPNSGQPLIHHSQQIDPNSGQLIMHLHHPDLQTGQQVQHIDPHTGCLLQHIDPQTGQPLQLLDPHTGQPFHHIDMHTGQLLQHIDPHTGQPLQHIDPHTGQPLQHIDPHTGQPLQHIDPHTGQSVQHMVPLSGQPFHHIDPLTGQHIGSQADPVMGRPIQQQMDALISQPNMQPVISQFDPQSGLQHQRPVQPAAQDFQLQQPSAQLLLVTSQNKALSEMDFEEEVPPPPSPPTVPVTKLPPNWKTAKDAEGRVYYYHAFTRQTQWEMPSWEDNDDDSDDMDLDPLPMEEVVKSKKKTTTAAADTSSEVARKIKDQFRSKMSNFIVTYLNPYRKQDCKIGRIVSTEDFKHLARKLTHHVMSKELKHCRHVEDLEVNENVKAKAKDYVRKYMSKFGTTFKKSSSPQPEDAPF